MCALSSGVYLAQCRAECKELREREREKANTYFEVSEREQARNLAAATMCAFGRVIRTISLSHIQIAAD